MQNIWKLEKTLRLVRDCLLLPQWHVTYGDFYIGSKRNKSDYLSVSGHFVA